VKLTVYESKKSPRRNLLFRPWERITLSVANETHRNLASTKATRRVTYLTTRPSTSDKLVVGDGQVHSCAFLNEFREHAPIRSLAEWNATRWRPFIERMIEKSALPKADFEHFLRAFRIICDPEAALLSGSTLRPRERAQVDRIAEVLPQLVTDTSDRDRWSREDLLAKLGWSDAIGSQRRSHQFPVGTHVQRNLATEELLRGALQKVSRGYISLLGPPGSGKSTLLQTAALIAQDVLVVRYLAFMPSEGHGLGRAEAEDFFGDLILQLRRTGLDAPYLHTEGLHEKREQFERLLTAASERFKQRRVRTVIIIDGLDHIPREEQPTHSMLAELPLPDAVPDGVIFMLGSQHLDLSGLPPAVRDQAALSARVTNMAPLTREAIYRFADEAGLDAAIDRHTIWKLSAGHPLALRYLVEALKATLDDAGLQAILSGEFSYADDVTELYNRVWHALETDADAQRVLDYVARAEGPIDPDLIARLGSKPIKQVANQKVF